MLVDALLVPLVAGQVLPLPGLVLLLAACPHRLLREGGHGGRFTERPGGLKVRVVAARWPPRVCNGGVWVGGGGGGGMSFQLDQPSSSCYGCCGVSWLLHIGVS